MAVKKISELDTKSFLGSAGAAANSYVLINYEDNSTNAPVTYKATIQELGKAIANELHLYKETANGATTTTVNSGSYLDSSAKSILTTADRDKLDMAVSMTDLQNSNFVFMASTQDQLCYNGAGGDHIITADYLNAASIGYVTNAISGLASTGYVTAAINYNGGGNGGGNGGSGSFDPTASVACLGMFNPDDSNSSIINLYPVMASRSTIYKSNDNGLFSSIALLGYDINGTDLRLLDTDGQILCTLTNVITPT